MNIGNNISVFSAKQIYILSLAIWSPVTSYMSTLFDKVLLHIFNTKMYSDEGDSMHGVNSPSYCMLVLLHNNICTFGIFVI